MPDTAIKKQDPKVVMVMANEIDEVEPMVRDMLIKAIRRQDGWTLDQLFDFIRLGKKQLWVVASGPPLEIHAAVVTEISVFPEKMTCFIHMMAGENYTQWLDQVSVIEDWATKVGCKDIEYWGRPGLARVLEGYEPVYQIVRKTLGDKT